jgi:hypothetical protein
MIIFNLWAILSVLIIAVLAIGLNWLMPSLFNGTLKDMDMGILITGVGVIGEFLGIRGRIFFMPIWMIGGLLIAYRAYELWGVVGIVGPLVLMGLALWWMLKKMKDRDAQNWTSAVQNLPILRVVAGNSNASEFWKQVKQTLHLPSMSDCTAEICAHNAEVAKLVLENAPKFASGIDVTVWSTFEAFLKENGKKEKPDDVNAALTRQLEEFLEARKKA